MPATHRLIVHSLLCVLVEAVCVPPDQVEKVWPSVKSMIDAAYAAGDEILPDLSEEFRSGAMLLWLAWDGEKIPAAATTRLIKARSGLVCKIIACGGEGLQRWKSLHQSIENYAKAEGCSSLLIIGREGWSAVFPEYQNVGAVMRKQL